jgi:WD40 repeat protein
MYHKGSIESYPFQTYFSALLFSPTKSTIRRLFRHDEPKSITVTPAMSSSWSACLQTLEGHSDTVRSVTFSHDSTRLASASDDKTVKLWDASSGECLQTLEGHSDTVRSVVFSHDSTQLASALSDKTVKLWDVSSGECLQTLEGHSDTVRFVAFSHDSTQLASALSHKTVKLWDVSSGECLQTLEGHSDTVRSVVFSHDSTRLASASYDKTVKLWDISSGECLQTFNVGDTIESLSFDPVCSCISSEIGKFAINIPQTSDHAATAKAEHPQHLSTSLSSDMRWIKHANKDMLWIPSEYRPLCSSVRGTTVAISAGSGRVWMCTVNA